MSILEILLNNEDNEKAEDEVETEKKKDNVL